MTLTPPRSAAAHARDTSGRARSARVVVDQAVSALTNFSITLAAARLLGLEAFGHVALAMTVGLVVMTLTRGLTAEPLLVQSAAARSSLANLSEADALRLALVIGLGSAATLGAVSALGPDLLDDLLWVGLCMPGLLVQDAVRYAAISRGTPGTALLSDGLWLAIQSSALLLVSATQTRSSAFVIACWGVGAAAGAVVGLLRLGVGFHGSASRWLRHTGSYSSWVLPSLAINQATYFGCTLLLAVGFSSAALGGARAMQAFVAPAFIALTAMQAVLVPAYTHRLSTSGSHALTVAGRATTRRVLALGCVAAALVIAVAPLSIASVFGSEFTRYSGLVAPFALGALGHAANSAPSAVLRARRDGRALLAVQVVATTGTVAAVLAAALSGSLTATVWAINTQGYLATAAAWFALRIRQPAAAPSPELTPEHCDRNELWLDLLRHLSAREPSWLVWKNVESALHHRGDIDSAARPQSWPQLEAEFTAWADRHDLWPIAICHHVPGGLNLFALPPTEQTLLEVSIKNSKAWRGGALFELDDLLPMTVVDTRGFRRLRPGAEGALKLVLNGTSWSARPRPAALRAKHVARLVSRDLEGVQQASRLFGTAAPALVSLSAAVAAGGWDRRSALRLQRHALIDAIRHPHALLRRLRFRLTIAGRCPLMDATLHAGRRMPADRAAWLERVRATHPAGFLTGPRPMLVRSR